MSDYNQCKKCNNNFIPEKGLINYCSLKCRNSRSWSYEDKLKKSISAKSSEKAKSANKVLIHQNKIKYDNKLKLLPEDWLLLNEIRIEKRRKQILEANYTDLRFEQLRERIIYEQNNKCNSCGRNEWLGQKMPLELEHKDGNHFNNERNNIEMLCPNCHALTKTWRGRNKKNSNVGKVSDEKLLEMLLSNNWNMRQSLIDVNLTPKGGNYTRCHRLKKEYHQTFIN